MANPEKPYFDNLDLQVSIIQLNFREPLHFTFHPFVHEILAWNPMPYKYEKPKTATKLIEINNADQFTQMIPILKAAPIWAVDLEHSCANSYAGITCLIQISTNMENFLIDPFNLNKEIKQILKPLMESKEHMKVMHGCFNDMRWLQRDFNIFTWPVIDTQIIYRYIRRYHNNEEFEHIPNINMISLSDLLSEYFPKLKLKNYAHEDFCQRPLPQHLKEYAVKDTMYLMPLLRKLKTDFETSTGCEFPFEDLFRECAVDVGRKALYHGKMYPSANNEMERLNVDSHNNIFRELYKWRNDLAKVLDWPPNSVLSVSKLVRLSTIPMPAKVLIDIIVNHDNVPNHLVEADLFSILDVIKHGRYEEFSKCYECNHQAYCLPQWRLRSEHRKEFFAKSWEPIENVLTDPSDFSSLLDATKTLWLMNKFPYSKSNLIGLYNFTLKELTKFIAEIQLCSINILQLLKCSICDITVHHAVVPSCGCENPPICCATCWISKCPACKMRITDPVKFEAVDKIVNKCTTFLATIQELQCVQRFIAIRNFLPSCELVIMCDICFGHLEKPMLVKNSEGKESAVCCRGCDTLYMESYGKYEAPILSKVYDEVRMVIIGLLNSILEYCQQNKTPKRENENKSPSGNSGFRAYAIERLQKEGRC